MATVILVIHLMIAVALVGLVLMQQSEGGALGIGGGGGGGGSFMTGRGAGSALTRATAVLAAAFFVTSLALALIAKRDTNPGTIFGQPSTSTPAAPGSGGVLDSLKRRSQPTETPSAPSVPQGQ